MLKDEYFVIGLMSGTSLDGIDLAYTRFKKNVNWEFNLLKCETIDYPDSWKNKLRQLTQVPKDDLRSIDRDYTQFISETVSNFISRHNVKELDFLASHGHTALHEPENGLTYQIGNLPQLATNLNLKVICDFRIGDVALGGQGAPLAPMGDELLFPQYSYCLNLGGFANLSTNYNGSRIAYDICPLNIVLNHFAANLGLTYDAEGKMASNGTVDSKLLNDLNSLAYYSEDPPKSLGLEWVEKEIFPLINSCELETQNILRTFVEHTAYQIAKSFHIENKTDVLITGGGAYNSFFIETLKTKTNATLIIPDKQIIEFKEALVFALLGVLKYRGEINVLSSVTGAKKDHSSGKIFSV